MNTGPALWKEGFIHFQQVLTLISLCSLCNTFPTGIDPNQPVQSLWKVLVTLGNLWFCVISLPYLSQDLLGLTLYHTTKDSDPSKIKAFTESFLNPLPHMPILGSSKLAANKNKKSKIWTNGDTIIWLIRKYSGKRRNCLLWAISHNVLKNCLLLMRQNEYLSEGLILM